MSHQAIGTSTTVWDDKRTPRATLFIGIDYRCACASFSTTVHVAPTVRGAGDVQWAHVGVPRPSARGGGTKFPRTTLIVRPASPLFGGAKDDRERSLYSPFLGAER